MSPQLEWIVPVDDGSEPIKIEIRSERVVPPCVFVDLRMPTRLLTAIEACQLGQALQDAALVAAGMGAKQANRRRG